MKKIFITTALLIGFTSCTKEEEEICKTCTTTTTLNDLIISLSHKEYCGDAINNLDGQIIYNSNSSVTTIECY